MKSLVGTAGITCLSLFGLSTTGSLADVEHVVLFMQENHAFDHVFVLCPLSSLLTELAVFRHYGKCPRVLRSQCSDERGQSFCLVPVHHLLAMPASSASLNSYSET
jgi:hypothetical protein